MRPRTLIKAILLLTLLAGIPAASAAQDQSPPPPEPAAAQPPLGENEPLPFMRTEQSAQTEEPGSAGILLKTAGSLAVIVGLIFVGAWGAKKLGFGNTGNGAADDSPGLTVLTSVSLGNGRTVSSIRFGGRILLVGSTPQSFTLLAEEGQDAGPASAPRSVADMLADEAVSFEEEFEQASSRLTTIAQGGRLI